MLYGAGCAGACRCRLKGFAHCGSVGCKAGRGASRNASGKERAAPAALQSGKVQPCPHRRGGYEQKENEMHQLAVARRLAKAVALRCCGLF